MVDRGKELEEVAHAMHRAAGGRAGVVLLVGEPGMGKSSLLAQARAAATAKGFFIAAAAASESQPLMLLSSLLTALGEPPEKSAMLVRAAVAGDVRPRLVRLVRARLEERISAAPGLICLDDVDQADPATLLTLRSLTQHLASRPLLWLLARSGGNQTDAGRLFDLLEREGAARVELGPLTDAAVTALVSDVLGAEPDSGLLALTAGADGNPFLLTELLEGLREEGALDVSAGRAMLVCDQAPQRFRHLVHDRMASLKPRTRQLLEAGAVIGSSFALEDVAEMLGLLPASLVPPLEEALAARFVIADDEAIAFRHQLIWQAVMRNIPAPARRALHGQYGVILLNRGGPSMTAAAHLLNGARRGDNRLLTGLDQVAREVLAFSPSTAADLATRALDLTDSMDPGRDERLITAVEALTAARRLPAATSLIKEALAGPASAALRAELRCLLASAFLMCARVEEARAEAEAVLAMCYLPARLSDRARVVLLRALAQLPDRRLAAGQATSILAAPQSVSDDVMLAALAVRAAITWDDGRLSDGLELSRQATASVARDSPAVSAFQPHFDLAARLVDICEYEEAATMLSVARQAGDGYAAGEAGLALLRARIYLAAGRLDDAVAETQTVLSACDLTGPTPNGSVAETLLAIVALRRGDLSDAERHLAEAAGHAAGNQARVGERQVLVAAQVAEGRDGPSAALGVCADVYDAIPADRWLLVGDLTVAPWLVRTALAADDHERASVVTAVVSEIAEDSESIPAMGSIAAHTRGLLTEDAGLLLRAAQQHADVWLRASAAEDLGMLLTHAEQIPQAIERLDQSLASYSDAGASRDTARIRHRLRRLGVRRRHWTTTQRPVQGWASLTDTELGIAELVAEGLTNRQAAERMFISAHTVAFHLRQIFRKLSIGSRVELARLTAERRV